MREGLLPSAGRMIGRSLTSVRLDAFTWFFNFGDDISVHTESLWRLTTPTGVGVSSLDHGHPFGLPQPVDAAERFGDAATIEFLQTSGGYESWRLFVGRDEMICTGGGSLMNFSQAPTSPNGEPQ